MVHNRNGRAKSFRYEEGKLTVEIDKMEITILKDGTIKTVTDGVSAANHDNAEQFLENMAKLAGGTTSRVEREDVNHGLAHHHGEHTHTHDGKKHRH